MKSKTKHNPFLHMAVFLSALFAILVVSAICMFYYVFGIPDPEGISIASFPHFFTENFSFWIEEEDGKISVNDTGIERLEQYGLWIQIMDESGAEVYSYNKPAKTPNLTQFIIILFLNFHQSDQS